MVIEHCKKIAIRGESGLGNRIRALISGMYLSERFNFPLLLVWSPNNACECEFTDLFENEWPVFADKSGLSRRQVYEDLLVGPVKYYGKRFLEDPDLGHLTIIPERECDFFDDAHIVYESPSTLGFISRSKRAELLGRLIINEGTLNRVDKFCREHQIDKSTYGVHIRETDHPRRGNNYYAKKIESIVSRDPKARFFLCSDSQEVENYFCARYPERVVIKPKRSYVKKAEAGLDWVVEGNGRKPFYNVYRDKQSVKEALEDMIVLTRTTFSVRSRGSFSDIVEWWDPDLVLKKKTDSSDRWIDHDLVRLASSMPSFQVGRLRPFRDTPIDPGISVITACMGRSKQLKESLESWRRCAQVTEIIIVDWSSRAPVHEWIMKYNDPRIIVVRADDQHRWILSRAYNLAASFVSKQLLCKVDTDFQLDADFFLVHALEPDSFYTGDHRQARNENEKHLNGFLFLHRESFFKCNGYNERVLVYGWEDTDMQKRLVSMGLTNKAIDSDYIYHTPHGDAARVKNQPDFIDVRSAIQGNKRLCQRQPWKRTDPVVQYESNQISKNHYECKPIVTQHSSNQPCLTLWADGDLASRLRALASAQALAVQLQRRFRLIWEPTDECGCEFNDLFDNEVPVVERWDDGDAKVDGVIHNLLSELDLARHHRFENPKQKNLYVRARGRIRNRRIRDYMEKAELKQLRPKTELWEQISAPDVSQMIGVHANTTIQCACAKLNPKHHDAEQKQLKKWRSLSQPSNFFPEIDRIVCENPRQEFLLLADNSDDEELFFRRYGKRRVTTPGNLGCGSSKFRQDEAVLISTYLLSRTQRILGSGLSPVSELAHKLGDKAMRIAGQDF